MIEKILEISFKKDGQASPLYLQLESEIIQLICGGIIKPGQGLPSSRDLAQRLHLNRKTVVATYEELAAQGWVEIKDRSGVHVSRRLPETSSGAVKEKRKKTTRSRQTGFPLIKQTITGPIPNDANIEINALEGPTPIYKIEDGFPDPRIAPIEQIVREYRRLGRSRLTNRFLMSSSEV